MKFPLLDNLIRELARFPGIGPKSAGRLAFFLLDQPPEAIERLLTSIQDFRANIGQCPECGCLTEKETCPVCSDGSRDQRIFCVVENVRDLLTIERSGQHKGQYHVLGGALSPLDGIGPEELTIRKFLERLTGNAVTEVILATNPTLEGEATASYLGEQITQKFPDIKITRIAHGVQTGGELEFADLSTLAQSFQGRRSL